MKLTENGFLKLWNGCSALGDVVIAAAMTYYVSILALYSEADLSSINSYEN